MCEQDNIIKQILQGLKSHGIPDIGVNQNGHMELAK